jgi:hypothetical protein
MHTQCVASPPPISARVQRRMVTQAQTSSQATKPLTSASHGSRSQKVTWLLLPKIPDAPGQLRILAQEQTGSQVYPQRTPALSLPLTWRVSRGPQVPTGLPTPLVIPVPHPSSLVPTPTQPEEHLPTKAAVKRNTWMSLS